MTAQQIIDGLNGLKPHREALWLVELGAWLHNMGKLHEAFVARMAAGHSADPDHDYLYVYVGGRLARTYAANLAKLQLLVQSTDDKDLIAEYENVSDQVEYTSRSFGRETLQKYLSETEIPLRKSPFNDRTYAIGDLIDFQDFVWHNHPEFLDALSGKKGTFDLPFVLAISHLQGSGSDKRAYEQESTDSGLPPAASSVPDPSGRPKLKARLKPQWLPWHASSVFGYEIPIDPAFFNPALDEIERTITANLPRRDTIAILRKNLSFGLADAQRPINDLRISQIGETVAAFCKSAVAGCLLGLDPEKLAWRLCRIAVNGPAYYDQAVRIPDILARRDRVHRLLDRACHLFEDEHFAANEVYRDDNGAVFLFADLGEELQPALTSLLQPIWRNNETGKELPFQIHTTPSFAIGPQGGLSFQLPELLKQPAPSPGAAPESLLAWWRDTSKPICTVCGLRPMGREQKSLERKVCDVCEQNREERCRKWLDNPQRTIWLEEVADPNGRIALITARARLGNWLTAAHDKGHIATSLYLDRGRNLHKSPSFARLTRVWQTVSEFWKNNLHDIGESLRINPDAASNPTKIKTRARLRITGSFRPRAAGDHLVSTHTYVLRNSDGAPPLRLAVAKGDYGLVTNENLARLSTGSLEEFAASLRGRSFDIEASETGVARIGTYRIDSAILDLTSYSPLIEIMSQPDMTQFLTPASSAFSSAEQIFARYEREMARVRNRLPLDIGIVYAPAATPLRAIVDAGRRMMDRQPSPQTWSVQTAAPASDGGSICLTFANGVFWNIPIKCQDGDRGTVDDRWYPYFLRNGTYVHVTELRGGDTVQVEPSTFDFDFLDSSARRFEIAYEPDADATTGHRRLDAHLSRPWPLEFLRDIRQVWGATGKLETSQIKQLNGILWTKRFEWSANWKDAKTWFVPHVIANLEPLPEADDRTCLVTAGISGLLQDAIQLRFGIEKRKKD